MTSANVHHQRAGEKATKGVAVVPGQANRQFHRERRRRDQQIIRSETTRLLLRRMRELVSRYG
jgi:hypothetical protein